MTRTLRVLGVLGAAGGLAVLYVVAGWWPLAAAAAAVGAGWLLGGWRGWQWSSALGLLLLVTGAAGAHLLGRGVWGPLLVVVAALWAWDLSHFQRQLQSAPRTAAVARLERRHLLRLGWVGLLSVGLAGATTAVRLQVGTGIALLLALLAVCGIGEVVAFFRRESD